MKMLTGLDGNVVAGETPCLSAVASTNGLNDEPGCRSPWTARLNWLLRELLPPIIASTLPSRGSTATSAAEGPFGLVSHFVVACRAKRWTLRAIVGATRRPPARA